MKIYLATGNQNKKREMSQILNGHTVIIPADEGIIFNPVENGVSFYENSLIKARSLYELVRCPVIADDSGICVDALCGTPGIYSARYAGPSFPYGKPDGGKIPQSEQNKFLVEQLNEALANGVDSSLFPNGPRSAHYTCAMVLYLGKDRLYVAEETMEGTIVPSLEDAAGTGGFGYDPLFFVPQYGKTAAQLSDKEKNSISHRGKATRVIQQIIKNMLILS
jgi:XTP/dITP diphosphohydrolase